MARNEEPAWLRALTFHLQAAIANVFVLHFNVGDYTGPDHRRVADVLVDTFTRAGRVVVLYDLAGGLRFPDARARREFFALALGAAEDDTALPVEPVKAFRLLEELLLSGRGAVIVEQAETVVPAVDGGDAAVNRLLVFLRRWATDPRLFPRRHRAGGPGGGGPVVLLTSHLTRLHPALREASAKTEIIPVPLPSQAERAAYVSALLRDRNLQSELAPAELSRATAGLSRMLVEDIALRAEAEAKPITREFVRERKQSLVRAEYGDVLEFVEAPARPSGTNPVDPADPLDPADPVDPNGLDALGGLDLAKAYCRRCIVAPLRSGDRRRAPMGVLFTGPPGTGKTAFFHALVAETGLPGVKLNPSRILGPYVGMSEQNLEKALLGIESLENALVFLDEIEQTLRRGSGLDSGVDQRLFARMLDWLADPAHRGRIVVVAASNRPDLMDPALKRAGRFDRKIPFLLPGPAAQAAVLAAAARRHELPDAPALFAGLPPLAGYSPAELEALLLKAWDLAGDDPLDRSHLLAARERMRPAGPAAEYMTLLALLDCEDRDLVPPEYHELWQDRADMARRAETLRMNLRL